MVKNLRKLRKEMRLSQQVVAAKLGISQQSVNKYENHSVEPDIATLIAMADLFQVSVDYLIGRTDENNNEKVSNSGLMAHRYKQLTPKEQRCVDAVIAILSDE